MLKYEGSTSKFLKCRMCPPSGQVAKVKTGDLQTMSILRFS